MATYLVYPDDAERGVPKFFTNLKTAKQYAATVARKINLNVRVWKENLKTGLDMRAATVRSAYLKKNPSILDTIRPGMRVTIVNRFGQQHSGKAVMRGPAGWVLNMGGPHGTPDIATPENIVKVSGKEKPSLFGGRMLNPAGPSAIPTKWTPATVSRKGRQIQIRVGGRR